MSINNYFEEIGAWPRGTAKVAHAYVTGFALSLALTFIAFSLAAHSVLPQQGVLLVLMFLACLQFAVQVMCFLHLGSENASRERLIALGCAALIVLILVSGSLWIMFTLNQRMTPDPAQMEQYMHEQQGI